MRAGRWVAALAVVGAVLLYPFWVGGGDLCNARNVALAGQVRPAIEIVAAREPLFAIGRNLLNDRVAADQFATRAAFEYLRLRNDNSGSFRCFFHFYWIQLTGWHIRNQIADQIEETLGLRRRT